MNNDISSITDEEYDYLVFSHFDNGCEDCVSSRDAFEHELELNGL